MAIFILIFWEDFNLGRNHVHCTHLTARHGIIAHRLWEENLVFGDDPLGLLPELFGKDFSRQNGPGKSLPRTIIPKESLTNFPFKDDGKRSHALLLDVHDCSHKQFAFFCSSTN